MSVKTLEIDGRMITGLDGETIFSVPGNTGFASPAYATSAVSAMWARAGSAWLRWKASGSCKPLSDAGRRRHEGAHRHAEAAGAPQVDRRAAAGRAQSRLRGVCRQRRLRAAGPGKNLGIDHVRLRYQFPSLPVDTSNERFGIDHNRCILCTRCVRCLRRSGGSPHWDVSAAAPDRASLPIWASLGQVRHLHRLRQVRAGMPTGALFDKGRTVAEMRKDRGFLKYIVTAREKKQWIG